MGITKLYQTEWNGISLTEVSEQLNVSIDKIADKDFYRLFYQKLDENGWQLQSKFIEEKKRLGKAVWEMINPSKKDVIISLGAGLGICEAEAIRGGV